VARGLFAGRGFLGVSVEDLVQAAAVSRPVLYYHFGSKEGLYCAASRTATAKYVARLRRAAAGTDSVSERIRRVCRVHAASRRDWALLSVGAGTAPGVGGDAGVGPSLCARVSRAVEILRSLVAEGIERGELGACDPGDSALALVGVAEVTAIPASREVGDSPGKTGFLEGPLAVVFRGLGARPQA
jgi:AcrR family transcriptional regulator